MNVIIVYSVRISDDVIYIMKAKEHLYFLQVGLPKFVVRVKCFFIRSNFSLHLIK